MKKIIILLFVALPIYLLASEENINESVIVSLNNKAKTFYHTNSDSVFFYAKKALRYSIDIKYKRGEALSYLNIGESYLLKSEYDSSLIAFKSATEIFEQLDNKKDYANSLNSLGKAYSWKGDLVEEYKVLIIALKIAEETENDSLTSILFDSIGINYRLQKKYNKSLEYHLKAKKIYEKNNKPRVLNLNNIGLVYQETEQYDKAEPFFLEAIKLSEKQENKMFIAGLSLNLGIMYEEINKPEKAYNLFRKSYDFFKEIGEKFGLATAVNHLAWNYAGRKNYVKAINLMNESLDIARESGNLYNIQANLESLAGFYAKSNDYKKAYNNFVEYKSVSDSILNSEKIKQIQEIETKYETEKKEEEIASQKKIIVSISIAGSILVISLVIIIILLGRTRSAYQNLVKKNLEIIENDKEPRKEIKKDLAEHTEKLQDEIVEKLEHLLRVDKVFTNSKLSIEEFAELIGTNRTYLSNIINSVYNCNYKTLINEFRVKEAMRILQAEEFQNYTIEAIAEQVGFVSKSTFNVAFKKYSGITPSFFKKTA